MAHGRWSGSQAEMIHRIRSALCTATYGLPGVFADAFLSLVFGSVIVGFHNVWTGIPAVVTVLGWANVLKGTLYFLFPAVGMKSIGRVRMERAHEFVIAGVVGVLVLSALVAYDMIAAS